jgi:hypothetical protein
MTQSQSPGIAAQPTPFLAAHENERAVDLIESAERSAPYCHCGSHMVAVARDGHVWLECAQLSTEKSGISAILARLTSFGHSRRMIMELPTAN